MWGFFLSLPCSDTNRNKMRIQKRGAMHFGSVRGREESLQIRGRRQTPGAILSKFGHLSAVFQLSLYLSSDLGGTGSAALISESSLGQVQCLSRFSASLAQKGARREKTVPKLCFWNPTGATFLSLLFFASAAEKRAEMELSRGKGGHRLVLRRYKLPFVRRQASSNFGLSDPVA